MNQSSRKVPPYRVPALLAQLYAATKGEEAKSRLREWLATAERDKRGHFAPEAVRALKAHWNFLYLGDTSSMKHFVGRRVAHNKQHKITPGSGKKQLHKLPSDI